MNPIAINLHTSGIRRHLAEARQPMFRLAYMWSRDRAVADDLTQEALTKALRHIGQLRDPERLRPWLFGILANCWRDHLRTRRPTEDIDAIDPRLLVTECVAEQAVNQAQLAARVHAAIGALPVGQREVLALVDLEGCTYADVSGILTIPIGTVMSRLCRARAALRDSLADMRSAPPALRQVK